MNGNRYFRFENVKYSTAATWVSPINTPEACVDLCEASGTCLAVLFDDNVKRCALSTVSSTHSTVVVALASDKLSIYDKAVANKRNVQLNRNQPYKEYACLWAETLGGKK